MTHRARTLWTFAITAVALVGVIRVGMEDNVLMRRGEPVEPLIRHTLRIKPERHWLVQGSDEGSGGLMALSQVGG